MLIGVAFACPSCTPTWLDDFMFWKLDRARADVGLAPLTPKDLPDDLTMGFGPRPPTQEDDR
jgi:hypothetical protein